MAGRPVRLQCSGRGDPAADLIQNGGQLVPQRSIKGDRVVVQFPQQGGQLEGLLFDLGHQISGRWTRCGDSFDTFHGDLLFETGGGPAVGASKVMGSGHRIADPDCCRRLIAGVGQDWLGAATPKPATAVRNEGWNWSD